MNTITFYSPNEIGGGKSGSNPNPGTGQDPIQGGQPGVSRTGTQTPGGMNNKPGGATPGNSGNPAQKPGGGQTSGTQNPGNAGKGMPAKGTAGQTDTQFPKGVNNKGTEAAESIDEV